MDVIPKFDQPLIIPRVDTNHAHPILLISSPTLQTTPTPNFLFLWHLLKNLKLMAMMILLF